MGGVQEPDLSQYADYQGHKIESKTSEDQQNFCNTLGLIDIISSTMEPFPNDLPGRVCTFWAGVYGIQDPANMETVEHTNKESGCRKWALKICIAVISNPLLVRAKTGAGCSDCGTSPLEPGERMMGERL